MYILYELAPRANTTDTLLYCASDSYETLQEILLSIFDNMVEKEVEWAKREFYQSDDEHLIDFDSLHKWCIERMKKYDITWLPYLEG